MLLELFNRVFCQRSRAGQAVLIHFINAILQQSLLAPVNQIIFQQNKQNYSLKDHQLGLEVKARTKLNREIDIQMQIHEHDYFAKQLSRSSVNAYHYPLENKHPTDRFIINLLNFNLLQECTSYHNRYQNPPLEHLNQEIIQEIHYLELPKLTVQHPQTALEKWLYFISYAGTTNTPPPFTQLVTKDPYFKLAHHLYQRVRTSCEAPIVIKEDQLNLIAWKDHGQHAEKERIALKMIEVGLPYQHIINLTELTVQELDDLALTLPIAEP